MAEKENEKVGGRSRIELKFTFCSEHRKTASVMDFLNDQVWDRMEKDFATQGREMPDRGSIELDFMHVHYGYCN